MHVAPASPTLRGKHGLADIDLVIGGLGNFGPETVQPISLWLPRSRKDASGHRDDIEAWINSQQLNDAQKKALMQRGRALQKTLLVALTDQAALQVAGEGLMASTKCGGDSFPSRSDFYRLANKIEAMTANTRQRAERYMRYNAARSGSSTAYPEGNTCEP